MDFNPIVIVAAAVAAFFAARMLRGPRIDGAQARELVEAGAQLVDVRSPAEFASGHIDGAINLPVQSIGSQLDQLDRSRAVVLYCRSGSRSGMAARVLANAGFTSVHNLGPMSAW